MTLVDMDKSKPFANYYGFTGLSAPSKKVQNDSLDEIMGMMDG